MILHPIILVLALFSLDFGSCDKKAPKSGFKYPFYARVGEDGKPKFMCGAVLVSKDHIITASPCLKEKGKFVAFLGLTDKSAGIKHALENIKIDPAGKTVSIAIAKIGKSFGAAVPRVVAKLPKKDEKFDPNLKVEAKQYKPRSKKKTGLFLNISGKQCKKVEKSNPLCITFANKRSNSDLCKDNYAAPVVFGDKLVTFSVFTKPCGTKENRQGFIDIKKHVEFIMKEAKT